MVRSQGVGRKAVTEVVAASVWCAILFFIVIPLLMWSVDMLFPPETTERARAPDVRVASPGDTVVAKGTYRINRSCVATFHSVMEWEEVTGISQKRIPPHLGSIHLRPGPATEVVQDHTIPPGAVVGSTYIWRTIGLWECYPWYPMAPKHRITYKDIRIEVR